MYPSSRYVSTSSATPSGHSHPLTPRERAYYYEQLSGLPLPKHIAACPHSIPSTGHQLPPIYIQTMASLLLRRPTFALGVGLSSVLAADTLLRPQRYRVLCDSTSYAPASSKDWSFQGYTQEAKTPVVTRDGRWNGRALRQVSMGSILGGSSHTRDEYTWSP